MKKIILILVISLGAILTQAQITGNKDMPANTVDQNALLLKSKKQKATAWILLGGGTVLTTAGLIIGTTQVSKDLQNVFNPNYTSKNSAGSEIMFYTGAGIMLGSIPLFIASGKNKKKANVIINNEKAFFSPQLNLKDFIAVGVKIKL